jgi:hypothetical protein
MILEFVDRVYIYGIISLSWLFNDAVRIENVKLKRDDMGREWSRHER